MTESPRLPANACAKCHWFLPAGMVWAGLRRRPTHSANQPELPERKLAERLGVGKCQVWYCGQDGQMHGIDASTRGTNSCFATNDRGKFLFYPAER